MFNAFFKSLLVITSLLTLISCTSTPSYTNIMPELNIEKGAYTFTNSQPWVINSQDERVARHLIEIVDGDNVAQLINEQQSLRLLIEKSLTKAWTDNQLKIDHISDYKVDIKLVKALATVTENTASYDVSSQMMIKVALTHQGKSFIKLFRSNKQWDAAFSANVANITKRMNKQLSLLLTQIVEDQELNEQMQAF